MEVVKHWLVVELRYFNVEVFRSLYLDEDGRYYISQDEDPCVLIDFKKAEILINHTKKYFKDKEEKRLKKVNQEIENIKKKITEYLN